MTKSEVKFNASDVLGAMCLEANRIIFAGEHFAAGANFPSAMAIQAVIDRLDELNRPLLEGERTALAMEVERKHNEPIN